MKPGLVSNSQSSCLSLLSVGLQVCTHIPCCSESYMETKGVEMFTEEKEGPGSEQGLRACSTVGH